MPVWVGSLDLAKTFDRMNWTQLWGALETNVFRTLRGYFLQFISTPVFSIFSSFMHAPLQENCKYFRN